MNYAFPYLLPDGQQPAMDELLAKYDSTLVGDNVYVEGDLITISAATGIVTKYNAVAAGSLLGLAGADWSQPFAKPYWLSEGVVINCLHRTHYMVFSYQAANGGAVADGADALFAAADLAAIQAGAIRDLVFNATEKCLTLRDTVATLNTPQAQMISVYKGIVGDNNVQVLARIQDSFLLSA